MKTATINIYPIYGTKSGICADIEYRGKLLTYIEGIDLDKIQATVRMWARNRGFSHVRMSYELPAIHKTCTIQA